MRVYQDSFNDTKDRRISLTVDVDNPEEPQPSPFKVDVFPSEPDVHVTLFGPEIRISVITIAAAKAVEALTSLGSRSTSSLGAEQVGFTVEGIIQALLEKGFYYSPKTVGMWGLGSHTVLTKMP